MYSEIVLSTHAFVPLAELKAPADDIERQLTLQSRYDDKLSIALSKRTDTHFGYPLYLHDYRQFTSRLIDTRSHGQDISVAMAPGFSLRDNQKPVLDRFAAEHAAGTTGWLLNMPTGSGKTACACQMLSVLGRTALIIVPRESLMDQWRDRIRQFTDLRDEDIGTAQQNVCDYEGKKVVIGMIHSLSKNRYPQEFTRYFGVVIWDEVHVAAAQSFSQTLSIFAPRYRIGMSATLSRRDGLGGIYRYAIGESLLQISPQTLLHPHVTTVPYKDPKCDPVLNCIQNSNYRRSKLISHLANDSLRSERVAAYIVACARSGRRTVCFSERIHQLETLRGLLIQTHQFSEEEVGLFTGTTKPQDRQHILEHCTIILATYGVMSMGVDVPDLRAIVFGTPQANVAQAVGRILRLHASALQPVVYDFLDNAYLDCHYWSKSRKKYYENIAGAEIETLAQEPATGRLA